VDTLQDTVKERMNPPEGQQPSIPGEKIGTTRYLLKQLSCLHQMETAYLAAMDLDDDEECRYVNQSLVK